MISSKVVWIFVLIAIALVSGCTGQGNSVGGVMQDDNMEIVHTDIENSMEINEPKLLAGEISRYYEFENDFYQKTLAEDKIILLYFYANWCPLCRAEQPKTKAAFEELDDSNVIGFRVNYKDSETDNFEEDLARKYGISYQHTKVILKNGERVLKAPDTWDKSRYLDEIRGITDG